MLAGLAGARPLVPRDEHLAISRYLISPDGQSDGAATVAVTGQPKPSQAFAAGRGCVEMNAVNELVTRTVPTRATVHVMGP
jgi:hypothetical protein